MKRTRVVNYHNLYEVDESGNIYSIERAVSFIDKNGNKAVRWVKERKLKPYVNKHGYKQVRLYKNGVGKTIPVHRIVCASWKKNLELKQEINHIDGDKLNNHKDNLEWSTPSENQKHAFKIGLQQPNKTALGKKGFDSTRGIAIGLYDINGNLLEKYGSILQAAEAKNIDARTLNRHIKRDNKIKTLWRIL